MKYTYVGSTKNLTKRKSAHKKHSENNTNTNKLYTTIRANGGFENWTMVKVEKWACESNLDARIRERHWYEKLNANLNMKRPQCTREETRLLAKLYHGEHKEEIAKCKGEWYQRNMEDVKVYNKQYNTDKREENREKRKQYYIDNKERFSVSVHCTTCNCEFSRSSTSKHNKSIHI